MKLKKGDKIKVMVGKDKGKEGAIDKIVGDKIAVAGVNVFKKHSKPRGEGQKGQIIDITKPIAVDKVALVCPKCKQVTRVGYKIVKDEKVRICRKCDQEL